MSSTSLSETGAAVAVTPAARTAIDALTQANGELMFHLSGGCCDGRTPICLPAGDLQIGPRDRLLGHADEVPVYEIADGESASASYELDVADGRPVGFSLSPGEGKCFTLRERRAETRSH